MIPSGKILVWLILIAAITHTSNSSAQQEVRFLFYNTENLFHPSDDSLTTDDEFTPAGMRHWTGNRYRKKLAGISKVIISAGRWEPPQLVALCEVENALVLSQLVRGPLLAQFDYSYIHFESPDRRGIDVALIYKLEAFKVITARTLHIPGYSGETNTRDILYVSGLLSGEDTLHIYISHWPSRYGGATASRARRQQAALILRSHIDSLISTCRNPYILIAGDMNDELEDPSLFQSLGVREKEESINRTALYSLNSKHEPGVYGTTKYQGFWYAFDHIIVSGNLLLPGSIRIARDSIIVHSPAFLLEEDGPYGGVKPFRTFSGYSYQEGFSDHLPVYIDLQVRPSNPVFDQGESCERIPRCLRRGKRTQYK